MFGGWGKGKKGDKNEISEAPDGGWNFDPTGFERAAKALKEINNAPNSDAALEIIKTQDATKRLEHEAAIEQGKARQLTAEADRIRVQQEEHRKTMEQDHYQKQKIAQYQDSLSRKRSEDEREAAQFMREQERQKNEASALRLEAQKRATLAQELDTRAKAAKDRAMAEAEGRILQERKNHDLKMKELRAEGDLKMKTMLESIKLVGVTVGDGISSYFSDTDKIIKTVGTLTAVAVGIYTAKVGTGIVGRFVESRLGKPVLVRETSKRTILDMVREPLSTLKEVGTRILGKEDTNALRGVVLEKGLASRLQSVAVSVVGGWWWLVGGVAVLCVVAFVAFVAFVVVVVVVVAAPLLLLTHISQLIDISQLTSHNCCFVHSFCTFILTHTTACYGQYKSKPSSIPSFIDVRASRYR